MSVKLDEIISEFVEEETIKALTSFIGEDASLKSADLIAQAFGADDGFSSMSEDEINKLVVSFKNNLTLLIQKTWVEKSDMALKDKLLYQLDQLLVSSESWSDNYSLFREIIDQAVFLMFGQKTDSEDFAEYSLRIDPEFGIFWWYISSLPAESKWSEEKNRVAMLLGMFFLSNY